MSIKAPNAGEMIVRPGRRAKKPKILLQAKKSRAKIGSKAYGGRLKTDGFVRKPSAALRCNPAPLDKRSRFSGEE